MNPMKIAYTVGVRRPFGLGWRKFRVSAHRHVVLDKGILELDLVDGGLLTVPDVGSKWVRVYPDREQEIARVQALQAQVDEAAMRLAAEAPRALSAVRGPAQAQG
jgi:hypothetical protein